MEPHSPSRLLGLPRRGAVALLVAVALALGSAAVAACGPYGHRHHGHGFFRHGHDDPFSPERVERMVRHVLDDADPSDDQVEAVTDIVLDAAIDLRRLHRTPRELHDTWTPALLAADRSALEAGRLEALAAFDEGSQRVVAALADVADVLTPEQRAKLAEAHDRFRD